MKRIISLGLSIVLMIATVTGCGENKKVTQNQTTEQTTEVTTEYIEESGLISNPQPLDYSAENIIEEAEKVYAWFVTEPLKYDEKTSIAIDGVNYYKVVEEEKNTEEKLSKALNSFFSPDIAYDLLSNGMYAVGDDGFLYTKGEGREKNTDIAKVEYRITEISENECFYQAQVTLKSSGEVRNYNFDYAKINGKWMFIDFPFFR